MRNPGRPAPLRQETGIACKTQADNGRKSPAGDPRYPRVRAARKSYRGCISIVAGSRTAYDRQPSRTLEKCRMRRIWRNIVQTGVRPDMSPREARFIKASNAVPMITGIWLLSAIPLFFRYWPAVSSLVVSTVIVAFAFFLTPILNKAGLYRSAQIYQLVIAFGVVTFNSLHMGHNSWNDLFLLGGILVSFYYIGSLYILIATTTLGLVLFAGVEWWYASGHRGLYEGLVPDQFFRDANNASIYSLVVLTIGFAYYNRATLNSTQRALDRELARSESLAVEHSPQIDRGQAEERARSHRRSYTGSQHSVRGPCRLHRDFAKNGCVASRRHAQRYFHQFRSRGQTSGPREDQDHRRRLHGRLGPPGTPRRPRPSGGRDGHGDARHLPKPCERSIRACNCASASTRHRSSRASSARTSSPTTSGATT